MLIIPAIDIKNGKCVRLKQGQMTDSTIFSDEPAAMARKWIDKGAKRLHLVDLDGAFAGVPKNKGPIEEIIKEVNNRIPIQLGGGIRTLNTIDEYIKIGISNIILGTVAVKNPSLLMQACASFSKKIIVGIDSRNGSVTFDGWSELSTYKTNELARKYEDYGVKAIIFTDVLQDGMMSGLNFKETLKIARCVQIPIIASGGLSTLEDIKRLVDIEHEGVIGVIAGRAIYEGSLNLETAQNYANKISEVGDYKWD